MSSNLGRFEKGQSGNPAGRPKARRPHISAFDIIFDKKLTVTQGGVERELTVDEGLQLQTYQAALKGNRMAVRAVLKMIEKREKAMAKLSPQETKAVLLEHEYDSDHANEAMLILGIAEYVDKEAGDGWMRLATWAAQAALSRPGQRSLSEKEIENIRHFTAEPNKLKWPRKRRTA
ncbi:DUF5681 domain-containing protein [Novosphingobium aquiterrae]|uniref:DUF5681 domain-containing protein n=1 Tax=Novosphingobium aquiterrae TaxID=624388 RepID=A0ABV6PGH2_9SPHN